MPRLNPETLIALRVMAGFSQAELARRSGVSQGHLSQIERGDRNASPRTIKRLADGLGVGIGALLTAGAAA